MTKTLHNQINEYIILSNNFLTLMSSLPRSGEQCQHHWCPPPPPHHKSFFHAQVTIILASAVIISLLSICFVFPWLLASGIFNPQPGTEPRPLAVRVLTTGLPGNSLLFISLLFYFWPCWVTVAALGLSLVAASGGHSLVAVHGFSLW